MGSLGFPRVWRNTLTQPCPFPRFADHLHKFHENGDGGDMWQ